MNKADATVINDADKIILKIDALNEEAWKVHITQPKRGLDLSNEAKKLSEEHAYKKGLAYALRNMGVSNRYLSNLETALSLSFQAIELFVQTKDKVGEAQAYVSVGAIYYYMGDYERALDYFLKGIRSNEETGNKEAIAYAFNGAGYIYSILGEAAKALDFLQKALVISKEINNSDLQSSILDSLAVTYLNDGQLDKAYKTYLDCLALSKLSLQKMNEGYALFGIGDLFLRQNRLDEAKEYFLQSLTIRKEIGYKVGEANSLLQLGKLFLMQKNSVKGREHLLESLKVGEDIKAKAVIYKAHEALAELYEQQQDFDSFAHHYKLYHKYKSEVFRDEQESKQKYLTMQFEMEKLHQETEINRLTNVVLKEKNLELEKKTGELEQSYNNISVLSKIGQNITSTLNLDVILNTVYENVNKLMDATVFGIGIYKEEDGEIEYRLAIEEGKRYKPYRRKMSDKSQLAVWCIENNKEVFINDIEKDHLKYLADINLKILSRLEDGSIPRSPHSLVYLPLQVKDKTIGLISIQSYEKNAYTQYHLDILKTLASYTSAALYNARSFETLQTALNTLKLTQDQLLQSEKMASLGELTAGIAHEIQNPLNFVNNFSELNQELIDELQTELKSGNIEAAIAVSNDVKENEEKINHHGKRADAIVKGMLQHSRKNTGAKEPTDINALCDEFLRLSYHGLRAKQKNFNTDFKTGFDKTIGKINIIPQDIGRVLLNLFNNAFYAVMFPDPPKGENYKPMVSVTTRKISSFPGAGSIEIIVKDNGNGIPENIVDKIFQPFFTTKPSGQGTGLGLSLSYDIIKAHGGEINVKTKEGEGSEFIIHLPVISITD